MKKPYTHIPCLQTRGAGDFAIPIKIQYIGFFNRQDFFQPLNSQFHGHYYTWVDHHHSRYF